MAELRNKILVERKGFAFFVEIEYENIIDFCDKCLIIGHDKSYCKTFPENGKNDINQNKKINSRKVFVPIKGQTYSQEKEVEEKDSNTQGQLY